jgi:hypothetical protein
MKTYKNKITLVRNSRGCYILDTVKGCSIAKKEKFGCYGDCYAAKIASRYGFNFSSVEKRDFERDESQLCILDFHDEKHENKIIKEIKKENVKFIRIGEMGDPSEDWEHTINVCKIISFAKKPIVIITKHWKKLNDEQLEEMSSIDLCINTSISALDSDFLIEHRLSQYEKLKNYCKSVLRIVSCDFNKKNKEGEIRSIIQDNLFKNKNCIDTVFRPSEKNEFVKRNIINVEKVKFLKGYTLASMYKKNTFMGSCEKCLDLCGVHFND